MTKSRILTLAGMLHIAGATLLCLSMFWGQPAVVSGSVLGFTPTPTSGIPEEKPHPNLVIKKSEDRTEGFPGDDVTYVVEVCNTGDKVAKDVVVSDHVPAELEIIDATASLGTAVIVGNGVRAEFGDMLPGVCAELTIYATIREDVVPGTIICNKATLPDKVSNEVCLTVLGPLPESGGAVPTVLSLGLLVAGLALMGAGLALGIRRNPTE
jgi:uncharacterized repeat protein (TIGR01451 family)